MLFENNLALEERPTAKSLMQIKNNKGPRMDSFETPSVKSTQLEIHLFITTVCFLSFEKSAKVPVPVPCC